jgi:GNAT superfamily N-acetyltransferase
MIRILHLDDSHGYGDFSPLFLRVSAFLAGIQKHEPRKIDYPWGRWEWMFSLPYLDGSHLRDVGVWEADGVIVALLTHESDFGNAYYVVDPVYRHLLPDLCRYAFDRFQVDGKVRLLIPDEDRAMQRIAATQGFRATEDHEQTAIRDLHDPLDYALPEGFRVVSLAEETDYHKYHRVLWRGFNHPGEPPLAAHEIQDRIISLSAPHAVLDRNVAVKAPDGNFVSYCGTWYLPGTCAALVEPVATDPDYRKLGLGKAAVSEALRRCKRAGARYALVGSGQEFYYRFGFAPYMTSTWWRADVPVGKP